MSDYTINVSVADGQIVVNPTSLTVDLDTGQDKTIDFVLSPSTTDKFLGIKIAQTQSALTTLTPTLDTQGDYYPGTCFVVSSPNGQTLQLQDQDRPGVTDSGDWYYCLGVEQNGQDVWDDPKVYNEGDAPSIHHKRHGS